MADKPAKVRGYAPTTVAHDKKSHFIDLLGDMSAFTLIAHDDLGLDSDPVGVVSSGQEFWFSGKYGDVEVFDAVPMAKRFGPIRVITSGAHTLPYHGQAIIDLGGALDPQVSQLGSGLIRSKHRSEPVIKIGYTAASTAPDDGSDAEKLARRIVNGIEGRLAALLEGIDEHDDPHQVELFVDELKIRLLGAIPSTPSSWPARIGPVFTVEGFANVTALTIGEVDLLIKDRRVLSFESADGDVLLPTRQLDDANQPVTGLAETLEFFDQDSIDNLTLSGWFLNSRSGLGGESVVSYLRIHGLDELLRAVVQRFAHGLVR